MSVIKRFMCLVLVYIFVIVLEAKESSNAHNIMSYNKEGYLNPFPEQCSELLDTFAQYASNFTLCSIKYARPIRLCTNCVDHFMKFRAVYKELADTVVNGTSCLTLFISQDRLDAVQEYHDNLLGIWERGHCNNCFNWSQDTPKLSNNTVTFNRMFKDTIDCIISKSNETGDNNKEVCMKCMASYVTLDEFYRTLSKDSIGVDSICMDTFDSMNTTRSIWSKTLHCCDIRKTPEIIFLCCAGIISLLPSLFYVVIKYYGPIRDLHNVLKESRFKQTILRSVQERIN